MGSYNSKVYIYAIINPIDGMPFYVGETSNTEARFKHHLDCRERSQYIISDILSNNLKPEFQILEVCEYGGHKTLEIKWMKKYLELGYPLINSLTKRQQQ